MVQNKYFVPDGTKWDDEDIVISGISARLPNCDSVEEFQQKLLAKEDLITDEPRRFQNGLYGAVKRYGLLKDLSKFDAKFFNIHPKQAERMDPQVRNLLEVAYETTVDAGLHPEDLSGTKTGVVVGIASSETQDKWSQMPERINGYEYTGCTRTMFANRISYYLDIKGPSYSIDTASSTTLVAFQQAYDMIRDGICDACFVCGTDLVLNPCVCLMFQCLNMLSPEGKCKAFDIGGDGYVRSEGVVVVLLQKAKVAKRVYASVLASGSNCDGYKDEGITFPSGDMQVKLFRRVAQLANIDPKTIDFMEAHGSATRVGDPQEMNAVTEVFTTGRKEPLRTGSIKSNMGHGEPASALSAVIKICVAMECGIIPPNLHYNVPNPDITALLDGRLKVITEPTSWDGGLVAVNSFGVGGANGHALLHSNRKAKHLKPDAIARLVCVSGVTKSAVNTMLNKIDSLPRDPELYALLHNIHRKNIKGHPFRGYLVMTDETIKLIGKVEKCDQRGLCFVFPGLESSIKSVNSDMMNLLTFQETINTCEKELKNMMKSFNLISVLSNLESEKSPLNLTVGLIAVQVSLIELLRSIQVTYTSVVGCNVGAITAAYANNLCNLQQAMTAAYQVGSALQRFYYPSSVIQTNAPWDEVNIPADVSICTKINPESTFFSGPEASIFKFAQKLKEKHFKAERVNYFVVDVPGILKNSNYIPKLKNQLQKLVSNSDLAESITNAASLHVTIRSTQNPVILNIAANVQGFSKTTSVISTSDGRTNAVNFMLAVGALYNHGFQPQLQNLYPKVEFPVSHATPMIQSMIEWDHCETWDVVSFAPKDSRTGGELEIVADFNKEEFEFLLGNKLNGSAVIPKGFFLYLVWKAMGRFQNRPISEIPLVIENVFFVRETLIPEDGPLKFTINILETSGKFEVWENGGLVLAGHVKIPQDVVKEQIPAALLQPDSSDLDFEMTKETIYKALAIKKYQYNDVFKQLNFLNFKTNSGELRFANWTSLIETLLQISLLYSVLDESRTSVVSFIRKVVITAAENQSDNIIAVQYHKKWNLLKSSCFQIQGIQHKTIPSANASHPRTHASVFVPFHIKNIAEAAEASLMFALHNWIGCNELKIAELVNDSTDPLLSSLVGQANPNLNPDITVYAANTNGCNENIHCDNMKYASKDATTEPIDSNCHVVIAKNVLNNATAFRDVVNRVRTNGCILLEENVDEQFADGDNVECISTLSSPDKTYILLKKVQSKIRNSPRVILCTDVIDIANRTKNMAEGSVLFVAKSSRVTGIVEFIKCMIAERRNNNLSVMLLEDEEAPLFSLTHPLYGDQLKKNFPINVYRHGRWGAYLPLSLPKHLIAPTQDAFVGLDYNTGGPVQPELVQANSAIYMQIKQPRNTRCSVYSAVINWRDAHIYNGNLTTATYSLASAADQAQQLGLEFAGYDGDRKVFGLVSGGALATSVIADKDLLWPIPEHWTFDEASTVPYPYSLAYYGLEMRANLQSRSCILIIGVNSVALAAIYIALSRNCNVFVLLNGKGGKPLLRKLFPQIKDTNMIVSNNSNFYLQVLQNTNGKGVQLVYNTLLVHKFAFQSYISCLAEKGSLVYFNNEHCNEQVLGSAGNIRCITFHRISLACFFEIQNGNIRRKVCELINDGTKRGVVQPLPFLSFGCDQLREAFQFASDEQNICKTIVTFRSPQVSNTQFNARARTYFDQNKSYVVSVDNEFGIYVTSWMVNQGARHILFVCPENDTNSEKLLVCNIEKAVSEACKITKIVVTNFDSKTCEWIIQKANQLAPLAGVFDFTQFQLPELGTMDAITKNSLETATASKFSFITNMDTATRKQSYLDYFVSFSSTELDYGIPKFSIYSYVNGILQSLMRNRQDAGLKATLVQWGKVGESGFEVLYNDLPSDSNISVQSVTSCLQTLHQLLQSPQPVASSYVAGQQSGAAGDSNVDVIVRGVAKFLGIKEPTSVLATLTLLELGLDSLICTDIQQFLEVNHGVTFSTQDVRELTFDKLRKLAQNL